MTAKSAIMIAALVLASTAAGAQPYPTRPVTLVVPAAPGGPADLQARTMGIAMARQLGQPFVVVNIGGASSTIGTARVAKADPDGYTLLYNNIQMATAPQMYPNPGFDPLKDFEFLSLLSFAPNVLLGRADFPGRDFTEVLAYLRANGERIMFADAGPGSAAQLCGQLFMESTGVRFTMVSYKGTGPAMQDLIGRQVDLMCDAATTAAPLVRAGKVKAIGQGGRTRLASLPGVPTLQELGLKGFEMSVFTALYAPAKVPGPIMERLVSALKSAMDDPDVVSFYLKSGVEPATGDRFGPEALRAYLKAEIDKWGPILRKSGAVSR